MLKWLRENREWKEETKKWKEGKAKHDKEFNEDLKSIKKQLKFCRDVVLPEMREWLRVEKVKTNIEEIELSRINDPNDKSILASPWMYYKEGRDY